MGGEGRIRRLGLSVACGLALVASTGVAGAGARSTANAQPYFIALPSAGSSELRTGCSSGVAAPLPGGKVLIAGGSASSAGSLVTSAELFDPATDTFTALSSGLHFPRGQPVAATLPDGKVLIAGGDSSTVLSSAELFDPATDKFAVLKSRLRTAGWDAVAVTLSDGDVLIAGGVGSNGHPTASAELFDPAGDTFTALPQGLHTARSGAVAAPLPDGKALIAGGQNQAGDTLRSAEVFVSAPR